MDCVNCISQSPPWPFMSIFFLLKTAWPTFILWWQPDKVYHDGRTGETRQMQQLWQWTYASKRDALRLPLLLLSPSFIEALFSLCFGTKEKTCYFKLEVELKSNKTKKCRGFNVLWPAAHCGLCLQIYSRCCCSFLSLFSFCVIVTLHISFTVILVLPMLLLLNKK